MLALENARDRDWSLVIRHAAELRGDSLRALDFRPFTFGKITAAVLVKSASRFARLQRLEVPRDRLSPAIAAVFPGCIGR